jgi:hypothetical protein
VNLLRTELLLWLLDTLKLLPLQEILKLPLQEALKLHWYIEPQALHLLALSRLLACQTLDAASVLGNILCVRLQTVVAGFKVLLFGDNVRGESCLQRSHGLGNTADGRLLLLLLVLDTDKHLLLLVQLFSLVLPVLSNDILDFDDVPGGVRNSDGAILGSGLDLAISVVHADHHSNVSPLQHAQKVGLCVPILVEIARGDHRGELVEEGAEAPALAGTEVTPLRSKGCALGGS